MQRFTIPIILLVTVILSVFKIFNYLLKSDKGNILSSGSYISPTPTPLFLPNGTITEKTYLGKKYLIFSVKVTNQQSKIEIIPNFSEKSMGSNLMEKYNCDAAINGGFYLGNSTPLGLFIKRGKVFGKEAKSSIANMFVWQDLAGDIKFVREPPLNLQFTNFIFQTGPYIIPGEKPLKLLRDERARRSLLSKDFQGNLYFISITLKDNLDGGPHLSDIPVIFGQLKKENILPFEEMVNLDGGSASFFYSGDRHKNLILSSWSAIGSILCAKFIESQP